MGFMGYLYGFQVFENPNMLIFEDHFTRKQTRKFKNRRWNKKYRKKYCKRISSPDPHLYIDNKAKRLYGHPAILRDLREQVKIQESHKHTREERNFVKNNRGIYIRSYMV